MIETEWPRPRRVHIPPTPTQLMSRRDAARSLGITSERLDRLIDTGELALTDHRVKAVRWYDEREVFSVAKQRGESR